MLWIGQAQQRGWKVVFRSRLRALFECFTCSLAIVLLIIVAILTHQVNAFQTYTGLQQRISRRGLLQQQISSGGTAQLEFVAQECGWRSEIKEQPFIVSIQLLNPVGTAWWHLCEGIQVTESLVLTTASCVWALRANNALNGTLIPNIYVAISPYCRHQKGRDQVAVQNFYMHPDYKQPTQQQPIQVNDLAFLKLNVSNTKFTAGGEDSGVYVLVDYDVEWNDVFQQEFNITGYGQKNQNDSMGTFMDAYYTNMLPHDVDQVKFLSDKDCQQKLNKYVNVSEEVLPPESYLCGVMAKGDLCTGDFGAPILLKDSTQGSNVLDAVLGVFSWKPNQVPCNEENSHPVLFTNISHYADWLVDMILGHEPDVQMSPLPTVVSPLTPTPSSPVPTQRNSGSSKSDSFPVWVFGLIAAFLLAAVVIFLLIYGRHRGWYYSDVQKKLGTSARYQIEEDEYYLTNTYTSILIPSLKECSTKDTGISAFVPSSDSKDGEGGVLQVGFPLSPDPSIMQIDINQISYPVNTRLLLNSLHRKALKGKQQKLCRDIPFNQKLVMRNHPTVDAVVSIQDGHEVTKYQPCYILPEIPLVNSEEKEQSILNLRLLSELNLKSMVPKAYIHRKHSDMQRSFLKRKGSNGLTRTINSNTIQQQQNTRQDTSVLMFPMAAESTTVLEEVDSEQMDIAETKRQMKTEQMLAQMRQQLEQCGMFIDVPREVELGRRLGGGNFGTVYEGIWQKHSQDIQFPVAVKVMKAGHCDSIHWLHYARQFMDEINMMARIKSNYVIRLYGGYITREEFVIVMELMEQGSLDGFIRRRAANLQKLQNLQNPQQQTIKKAGLPLIEVVKIMLQIAKGLSELHPSVVHRDLKPQNILLDRNNRVKIGDLGLSKMKTSTLMSVSEMKGTPAYIAPEVFMNANISEKCDMYAFAVIFWECITGQKPWVQYQMPVQIMHDVIWKGKRPPIPYDCDESVKSIIEKCWDKEPLKRLSAYEVGTRLQRLLYQLDEKVASQFDLFPQATKSYIGNSRDLFSRTFFQPKPKIQRQSNQALIQPRTNAQNVQNSINQNSQATNSQIRISPQDSPNNSRRKKNERYSRINSQGSIHENQIYNQNQNQNTQQNNQLTNGYIPQNHNPQKQQQQQNGTSPVVSQQTNKMSDSSINSIQSKQNNFIQKTIIPDVPQYNGQIPVVPQHENKQVPLQDNFQENDFDLNLNILKGLGGKTFMRQQQVEQVEQVVES